MPLFKGRPAIEQISEKIDELLEEGMLIKVDWEELKTRTNRHYENEWKRAVSEQCYGGDDPMSWELLDVGYPSLHTLNSKAKKLDKAIKNHPDSPFVRVAKAGHAIIDEMRVFAPKMESLKGMIKTGQQIKEAKNPKPIPKIDPKAKQLIKEAMEEIAGGVHSQVFEQHKARQLRAVKLYDERVTELPEGTNRSPHRVMRDYPEYASLLTRLYQSDWRTKTYLRVNDFDDLIDKNATKEADMVRDVFVHKQVSKLPAIATALGDLKSIKGHLNLRGRIEASLRLEFEQGASFNVNTKVVFSTSVYGKVFPRYPTTFHDVIDKNGEEVGKMLSEDEMHAFAGVEPLNSNEKTKDGP